jgi:hypothetical protein
MIKEICKECGGDIMCQCFATYPASYEWKCMKCGRIVKSEKEELVVIKI